MLKIPNRGAPSMMVALRFESAAGAGHVRDGHGQEGLHGSGKKVNAMRIAPAGFRSAQWRMLLAAMFCYLFFYTGRQTFGFAIPGIERGTEPPKGRSGLVWHGAVVVLRDWPGNQR